jgi:hypothetical protein
MTMPVRTALVSLALGLGGALHAQGVAMVADLQGRASLQGDGLSEPLTLTAEIPQAREVRLEAGCRLVLIAYRDGEELTVRGPLRFRLDPQGHPMGSSQGFTRKRVDAPRLQEALKPGGLAQASLVMRAPDGEAADPAGPDAAPVRVPAALKRTLEALRAQRKASFARGLVYASALAEAGLHAEAQAEWRRLAALRPDDPVLKAYAESGGGR